MLANFLHTSILRRCGNIKFQFVPHTRWSWYGGAVLAFLCLYESARALTFEVPAEVTKADTASMGFSVAFGESDISFYQTYGSNSVDITHKKKDTIDIFTAAKPNGLSKSILATNLQEYVKKGLMFMRPYISYSGEGPETVGFGTSLPVVSLQPISSKFPNMTVGDFINGCTITLSGSLPTMSAVAKCPS